MRGFLGLGFFRSFLVASLRVLIKLEHSSSHQGALEGQKISVILILGGFVKSSIVGGKYVSKEMRGRESFFLGLIASFLWYLLKGLLKDCIFFRGKIAYVVEVIIDKFIYVT